MQEEGEEEISDSKKEVEEVVIKTEWSPEQAKVLELALQGRNLFVTGGGGVGKSFVIRELIRLFIETKRNFCVTGSTGAAAVILDGVTLHSLLGVGLATGPIHALVTSILRNPINASRWGKMQTLIVDEISMMDPFFFDRCDKISRVVRDRSDEPFGGIQIILVGDFYQLPAINKNRDRNGTPPAIDDGILDFCFELPLWQALNMETIHLTQVFRQSDPIFASMLNRIRSADHTHTDIQLLQTREFASLPNEDGIIPTNLWSHKANVEKENLAFLENLEGEEKVYEHKVTQLMRSGAKMSSPLRAIMDKHAASLIKNAMAPATLKLKINAQVMLVANLDFEAGLVNGSRGVVVGFSTTNQYPVVHFACGVTTEITPKSWSIDEAKLASVNYWQIPLVLAWNLTIHKCVVEDTLISTCDGLIPISEISPLNQKPESWAPLSNFPLKDRHGKIQPCDGIYKGKETREPCLRFMTQLGNIIECTGEHPFLVFDPKIKNTYWKQAKCIELGDSLLLRFGLRCEHVPKLGEKSLSENLCYRLGQNRDCISNAKYFMLRNCEVEKNKFSSSLWHLKCIPKCILRNTISCQARFIEGVFDMPIGTIDFNHDENLPYDKDMHRYSMNPSSMKFYKQIYALLVNLGIRGGFNLIAEQPDEYGNMNLQLQLIAYPHMMIRKMLIDTVNSRMQIFARTLDKVSVSTRSIFAPGQAYVALSRARSLEGLSLKEKINPNCIKVHPKVKYFYEHHYKPYKTIHPSSSKSQIESSSPSQPTSPQEEKTPSAPTKRKKTTNKSPTTPQPKRQQPNNPREGPQKEVNDPTQILEQFYSKNAFF